MTVERISVAQLRAKLEVREPLQLLDVRSAPEYATGHVPGAFNIPMEQLESRLADLNDKPVVVICQSGRRAEIAAQWLTANWKVNVLEGGTNAWTAAGFGVVTCTPCRWALERQVRFAAGIILLAATLASLLVHPYWIFLAMFVGAGLTFAGLTNICGMALLLARMPWNRSLKTNSTQRSKAQPDCCREHPA